jgi:hypothetical protein
MKDQRFNIVQSEEEDQNLMETAPNPPEIDLYKLAESLIEKLRKELEIENERTGHS